MGCMPECNKPLIPPIYSQAGPNEAIELGSLAVEFSHQGRTYQRTARVAMQFVPRHQLLLTVPAEDVGTEPLWALRIGHSLMEEESIELRLTSSNISIDVFCLSVDLGANAIVFCPRRALIPVAPARKAISGMVFHLFNFPDFLGSDDYSLTLGEPPSQGVRRCGRIILKADGWQITVAGSDRTKELVELLKQQGGYVIVITHMGKIEREDMEEFAQEKAAEMLNCARQFLSLALGRWIGTALPIGFDSTEHRAFEQWNVPLAASGAWHGSNSWFDEHHGILLSEVFPAFFDLWAKDFWKEHIRVALYWYLAANERATSIGVDAGTILAQTALERLAWAYCVEHRKMVSQSAFLRRGLSASDKLRMLLVALDIPTKLPETMTALNAKPGEKWVGIPEALTSVRNALVHPSEKKSFLKSAHYYEAWQLSMWLLNLVFLRLCNHQGKYSNRLIRKYVGEVECVPWAKPNVAEDDST